MSVHAGPTPIANFENFLTNLSKNSPNLSKEEIVEKMIAWVDENSVDSKSEKALLKQIYLMLAPDKLDPNSAENAKYLKKNHRRL